MNRLIDADALMHALSVLEFSGDMGDAMEILDNFPTVDAVEVVRCKDCKWCNKEYYGEQETEWVWYCPNVEHMVGDNWFCADGEKKVTK